MATGNDVSLLWLSMCNMGLILSPRGRALLSTVEKFFFSPDPDWQPVENRTRKMQSFFTIER
jgi:hypothetical protein